MATLPTVGSDTGIWGTKLNTWLSVGHNSTGTVTTPMLSSQSAEGVTVPVFKIQPFTSGKAPFEIALSSALFNGTEDQVAFWGFNAESGLPGGSPVSGQQVWQMGMENQYNNGTNTACEWYIQYVSSTAAVNFRPMQFSTAMTSPTNYANYGFIDLGNSIPAGWDQSFTVCASLTNPILKVGGSSINSVAVWNTLSILGSATAAAQIQLAGPSQPSIPVEIVWTDNGSGIWQIYLLTQDDHLFIRDLVNSRMHVTYTAGASATAAVTELNSTLKIDGRPAFVSGDKYLVCDSNGNVHVSSLGPAS